jgi:predicted secreted protein
MRYRIFVLVLGAALATAACVKRPPEATVRVFDDARQVVRVRVGEAFGLSLSYNPTVSPDYRPDLQQPLPAFLALVTTDYVSSEPGSRKTGVGGTKTWILKGLAAGEGKVVFACKARAGASDDATFTVVVAGP